MANVVRSGLSVLSPAGHLITYDETGTEVAQADTVQCVHCGRHWVLGRAVQEALSGRLGFCRRCNGIHCPRAECEPCVPQEKWLDFMDRGIDLFGASELDLSCLPVSVPVGGLPNRS